MEPVTFAISSALTSLVLLAVFIYATLFRVRSASYVLIRKVPADLDRPHTPVARLP